MSFPPKAGLGLILLGMAFAPAHAAPSGPLFIDDANGLVGTVNISTGAVTVLGSSGATLTDIAFTANGTLYGTTFTGLYSLNPTTAAATLVASYGGVGGGGVNALVGSSAGLYAASGTTNQLYSVGVAPFSIAALSGTTSGGSAGDLAFASSGGALYETLSNGDLDRITITGGAITSAVVGNTGLDDVFGLATGDDGITYAVAGTEIYTVNLSTAALTPTLNYAGSGLAAADGTAFFGEAGPAPTPPPPSPPSPTPVPEPATVGLLGLAAFGITLVRRRTGLLT